MVTKSRIHCTSKSTRRPPLKAIKFNFSQPETATMFCGASLVCFTNQSKFSYIKYVIRKNLSFPLEKDMQTLPPPLHHSSKRTHLFPPRYPWKPGVSNNASVTSKKDPIALPIYALKLRLCQYKML